MLEATFRIFMMEIYLLSLFAVAAAFSAGYITGTHKSVSFPYRLLVGTLYGLIEFLLFVVINIYIIKPVLQLLQLT